MLFWMSVCNNKTCNGPGMCHCAVVMDPRCKMICSVVMMIDINIAMTG